MEHQSPDLNTLPRLLAFVPRIDKRAVRDASRPSVDLGIEALDQRDFLGRLLVQVMPSMVLVGQDLLRLHQHQAQRRTMRRHPRHGNIGEWAHGKRLAHAIWVDQLYGQQVLFGDGFGVDHAQGVFADSLDRTPYVDDLVSSFEKAVRVVR